MFKLNLIQSLTILTVIGLGSCLKLSSGENISGQCLNQDLKELISGGCQFDPSPAAYNLLKMNSRPASDFNFGQATFNEAIILWQKPKFIAGYFKKAIANPKTPLSGEIAAGTQLMGDYTVVGMQNIHLCSEDGVSADYSVTNVQVIIETSKTSGFSADDIRNAAW